MATSSLASIEYARDFQYLGNEKHVVKLTKVKISQTPVVGGKLIKMDMSAVNTDKVIRGGQMVISLSLAGNHMDTQKCNLSDAVSCPISAGDFEFKFCQLLPADVISPGTYTFKLELLAQDGRQLTCVTFDYTVPNDHTVQYPEIA